jgi:hypothetical protein
MVETSIGDDLLVDDARKIAGRKTGASEWIAVCHPTGWGAGGSSMGTKSTDIETTLGYPRS